MRNFSVDIAGKIIRRRGFTLVELLVVIAIIALLLSVLMPALQSARKSANTVICGSNLRQLGLSFRLYYDDFKRQPEVNRDGSGYTWSYCLLVNGYIQRGWKKSEDPIEQKIPRQVKVMECPQQKPPGIMASWQYHTLSYAMNAGTQEKELQNKNLSSTILLVDAKKSKTTGGIYFFTDYATASYPPWTRFDWNTVKDDRHNKSSNFLYMDYHVNKLKNDSVDNLDSRWGYSR
ncbi:MAG: type II secretion system protein [Sedimentisphaerales bacterium]